MGKPVAFDASAGVRLEGELDVRSARRHADGPDHRKGCVAHPLELVVVQCHRRRDGDRVTGVHAHGVDVLDRAHDDGVVV
jgi:hypothetical protein